MIIPAMDLLDKAVVRLYKGDYNRPQFYDVSPLELVHGYKDAGADIIHVIDLEGARDADKRQLDVIATVVKQTNARFQVGGGIRSESDVQELLDIGVERVIIGSLAIKQPAVVSQWVKKFGKQHIVLALDVSIDVNGKKWLPTKGWKKQSGMRLEEILYMYDEIEHVLCTDIGRDGTLEGSNTDLYKELVKVYSSIKWMASGGIGGLDDISSVAKTGATGVIVGKALLNGIFTLEEAQACWRDA
ncbi:MAG: 1-(5-phosphoribosyl)-5-[(5-phosphoribosylamino)methylideneamino]imidazole-4-carboxamide isomerase [Candidatus Marinimicrobia bacterium]|nr:1-(5-phosphoribosyl)-5-[(5-phosphoribosylamino)methylideneamino]imidazole-4-carboxamide isomerase [Candidatus Neomarinimicrobiota bacterium]MCF7850732.1 1-(5-phosphoribosyl)-5-[(5-phosphoribosylamino)methylideneamino]imidazole-4-carboxamide isomerase [Candidatus Neomarinimicrobiota bacterium]